MISGQSRPTLSGSALRLASLVHSALLRRGHLGLEAISASFRAPDGTVGKHELSELTIDSDNQAVGVHFLSTPWAVLRWMHAAVVPDADKPNWTFVDLGAGKGRAVLSAAAQPYRQVIGVEFAAELAAQARTNIDADGHDPARVQILEGDASAFTLPEAPCVVFLFNPFGPPVLERVIDRILTRSQTSRHPIRVAYLNPVHRELFAANPAFRQFRVSSGLHWRMRILSPYRLDLYETMR